MTAQIKNAVLISAIYMDSERLALFSNCAGLILQTHGWMGDELQATINYLGNPSNLNSVQSSRPFNV